MWCTPPEKYSAEGHSLGIPASPVFTTFFEEKHDATVAGLCRRNAAVPLLLVATVQVVSFRCIAQGCSPEGSIIITDMDQIEKSNLSRQFLFRHHHIKSSKSTIAAQQAKGMNPALNVRAMEDKVAPETEGMTTACTAHSFRQCRRCSTTSSTPTNFCKP